MRLSDAALFLSAILLGASGCPRPAVEPASPTAESPEPQWQIRASLPPATMQALAAASARGGRLEEDFRFLSDVVGPRMTGSAAVRRANEWAAQRLREHPLDSVWLEQFSVPAAWERGGVAVTQLAPHRSLLRATALAWSPPTPGPVAGEVLVWEGEVAEAPRIAGVVTPEVRNAWLVFPDGRSEGQLRGIPEDSSLALLVAGRAAGVLLSGPDDPLRASRLGTPSFRPPVPHVILPGEGYDRLVRLAAAGVPARIEGVVAASLTPGAVAGYNTVAEIRGSEWPSEIVLVAVPLDSWDDAVLATDDGLVVASVLEAARILSTARVRPRRTIRFAFLGGEMQEQLGEAEYGSRHAGAMNRHVAVVRAAAPVDGEEPPPEPLTMRVRPDLVAFSRSIRAPGTDGGSLAIAPFSGARSGPLAAAGVPIFELRVDSRGAMGVAGPNRVVLGSDAARHIAAAALTLAELESFPR